MSQLLLGRSLITWIGECVDGYFASLTDTGNKQQSEDNHFMEWIKNAKSFNGAESIRQRQERRGRESGDD
jgi:hypothetical protein